MIRHIYYVVTTDCFAPEQRYEAVWSTLNHVVGRCCWERSKTFPTITECRHGAQPVAKPEKPFMTEGGPAHAKLQAILETKGFKEAITQAAGHFATSLVESYNAICAMFTPKDHY